jgi:hypothetical protein
MLRRIAPLCVLCFACSPEAELDRGWPVATETTCETDVRLIEPSPAGPPIHVRPTLTIERLGEASDIDVVAYTTEAFSGTGRWVGGEDEVPPRYRWTPDVLLPSDTVVDVEARVCDGQHTRTWSLRTNSYGAPVSTDALDSVVFRAEPLPFESILTPGSETWPQVFAPDPETGDWQPFASGRHLMVQILEGVDGWRARIAITTPPEPVVRQDRCQPTLDLPIVFDNPSLEAASDVDWPLVIAPPLENGVRDVSLTATVVERGHPWALALIIDSLTYAVPTTPCSEPDVGCVPCGDVHCVPVSIQNWTAHQTNGSIAPILLDDIKTDPACSG